MLEKENLNVCVCLFENYPLLFKKSRKRIGFFRKVVFTDIFCLHWHSARRSCINQQLPRFFCAMIWRIIHLVRRRKKMRQVEKGFFESRRMTLSVSLKVRWRQIFSFFFFYLCHLHPFNFYINVCVPLFVCARAFANVLSVVLLFSLYSSSPFFLSYFKPNTQRTD